MALPASGPITLAQIATEFAKGNNLAALYSAAAGIPASGAISMGMFRGLSAEFILNIASNIANPNIRQLAVNAGWNTTSKVKVNITAPLVNTIDIPAGTSFPGGLEITISAGTRVGGVCNGGNALTVGVPVTINNAGIISGGGGRGGSGQSGWVSYSGTYVWGDAGGGGSGQGFENVSSLTIIGPYNGGAGTYNYFTGALYGGHTTPWIQGGTGGQGGTWGAGGAAGGFAGYGGSYDGVGLSDRDQGYPTGKSVVGNGNITWLATGTRLGPVI